MRSCSIVKNELVSLGMTQPLVSCSYDVVSPLLSPSFSFRSPSEITQGYIPNSYVPHAASAAADTYYGYNRYPSAAAVYLQPSLNPEHRK